MNKNSKEKIFISRPLSMPEKTSFQVGLISAHFDSMVAAFGEPDESGEDKALTDENFESMEFDIPEHVDEYDLEESIDEDRPYANERVRDYEWRFVSSDDHHYLGRVYGSFSDSQYCENEKSNWIIVVDSLPQLLFKALPANQELLTKNYEELIEHLVGLMGSRNDMKMELFGALLWR